MNTSDSIGKISEALAKAQAELTNPPKNKENPHFKSKYVDLSDGLDCVRKVLSKNHIAFVQSTTIVDGMIVMHTRLMHISGEWLESIYPVSGLDKHQAMGSAMTYARRYSLFAMVGIAGEDDDDGNTASDTVAKKPAPKIVQMPKQEMEPGFSEEESETVYNVMTAVLSEAKSLEDLREWATQNQSNKNRLRPAHQKKISEDFKAVEKSLRAA
jgi:hypothetical protein